MLVTLIRDLATLRVECIATTTKGATSVIVVAASNAMCRECGGRTVNYGHQCGKLRQSTKKGG